MKKKPKTPINQGLSAFHFSLFHPLPDKHCIAKSEKQLTIYDNASYPQFMKYDSKLNTLSPVTDELLKPTVISQIFAFLSKLIAFSAELLLLFTAK